MTTADDAPRDPAAATELAPAVDDGMMTHVTRRAMATEFVALLPSHAAEAVETVVDVMEQLDRIEHALTIYHQHSEVSRLNRRGSDDWVSLSPATFDLIRRAQIWSERTAGAFDITAGPLVEAWGFTRRSGRKPSKQQIDEALTRVGAQHVQLDPDATAVQFAVPGMAINLGAIGKGDALDRLAAALHSRGVHDFLIHGGNSSVIAAGDQQRGSGRGWAVGVAHPSKPKRRLAGLWLKDAALGTSGAGKQFFHHQGRRYGHVIDPRSGYPAGDLLSLTVIMPSAADADACATGMYVAGSETILQWAQDRQRHDWFPAAILVRPGRRQDEVELESLGDIRWVDPTTL